MKALDGKTIDFSKFKGKKILIVNTASECGFTPQYEGLQKLYETYKDQLVIVGFPANNFGGQEPGSNEEIGAFCKKNYVPESFDTDFIDYENKGFTAQVLGKEKVGERDCYKVELTKNVNKTVYYFDVQNFLLLKEEKKDETLVYSDFKKVNNLVMPFRIEATTPKKEGDYVMILFKIEVNKAFPANTFKF